ncbi:hypothetical protein ACUYO6_003235 [Vibrio vulnificus]|uniref:hypothetical protein n=1 Tax=Vibrio vulnificus TaxID=672 RepID=UPI003241FD07|nr:hypothetical protein [Vibrio parahaemolyticus]
MPVTEEILRHQLEIGFYDEVEPDFARGIAQLAVDNGFSSLSPRQQGVLEPFLSQQCSGLVDPGGYHNSCARRLSEGELLEAYQEAFGEDIQCESCREEANFHQHQWERIDNE